MAFNEPLMLNPPMRGFSFVRLQASLGSAPDGCGIRRQPDCRRGTRGAALSVDDDGPRQARSYQVMNGSPCCRCPARWSVGRERCSRIGDDRLQRHYRPSATGCQRPVVDGILLDMDTPGGMVAGAFTALTSSPVCVT